MNATPTARATNRPLLRISLFGSLRVWLGERTLIDENFTRRKAKALLAYLYLQRGHHVSADEILEVLWPDVEDAGTGRLKQTVLTLRTAIESRLAGARTAEKGWRYIREQNGFYYFNAAEYTSDVEEFERELTLAGECRHRGDTDGALTHYTRALELRQEEFLYEFRYEHWAAAEAARLQELYLDALEEVAGLYAARHACAPAVALLRQALREDPLRESAYLDLMRYLWLDGKHVAALRVYQQLRDALARHLQVEPEPAAVRLAAAIRRDRTVAREGQHEAGREPA